MKHSINLDVEVADLVMSLDEALSETQTEWEIDFGTRQNSDWITNNGGSEESIKALDAIQSEILRRALVVIRTRWERSGN